MQKIKWPGFIGRKKNKEDVISPTVSIGAALQPCAMDAKEGCEVATLNIAKAFIQAEPDELICMKRTDG